jgi:hypothetical protein
VFWVVEGALIWAAIGYFADFNGLVSFFIVE